MSIAPGGASPTASTLSPEDVAGHLWPVIVVGAGPAGSLAARELARGGTEVLLVDKAAFPRPKVCGGCLGPAALTVLEECGLGHVVGDLGGQPATSLRIVGRTGFALLPLGGGAAVSREVFDAALVREAVAVGARFLDRTEVRLAEVDENGVRLSFRHGSRTSNCIGRVVVAADGLGGSFLAHWPRMQADVAAESRIGLGTVLTDDPFGCEPGIITMTYGPGGYVGMVRVEGGRLTIAGALDAAFLREAAGNPGQAVIGHLAAAGIKAPRVCFERKWMGTPRLTRRRRRLWDHRLLVIGDAAGYVEPFTGEGMAWGLRSGRLVASFARQAVERWSPATGKQWQKCHRSEIQRHQWICRRVAALSRSPKVSEALIRLCGRFPWLAGPVIRRVSRPGDYHCASYPLM